MSFPTKEERTKCWSARDQYWECLDKNSVKSGDTKDINVCAEFRKMYEQSCSAQWVKHFDRKRNYLIFKEKIEKDGIPSKNEDDSSISLPRRIYNQII
ncbi:unnamed protein product [Psylliodes chrysocephalus]|uniref:Cytochrome c oxidase assembly factor 6 homolog n=1 Tax=Psylliodes chrysocephalus TaxID=3402493 RepID=A0A9P0D151_9CUCU|nr:unnamed protein product [Psylliodes chrysocephala]